MTAREADDADTQSHGRAPRPNLALRHARREARRQAESRDWWWFIGGFWGWLLSAIVPVRAGETWRPGWVDEHDADGGSAARLPAKALKRRSREERRALKRAAWRRHFVRTTLVVGAVLILYVLYAWVRLR